MEVDIFEMSRSVVQSRYTQDCESRDNETVNSRCLETVATGDAKGQWPDNLQGDNRLLAVQEVAEYLRVSRSLVYKMIRRKEIPAIRVGRLLRVDPRDLAEALRATGRAK